jgi:hypothetical protein
MQPVKRSDFLRMGLLTLLAPLAQRGVAYAHDYNRMFTDEGLLNRLVAANDRQVEVLLKSPKVDLANVTRKVANDFSVLAASYCCDRSSFYRQQSLTTKMMDLVAVLLQFQTADGTLNIGNLESPPDTAFVIEILSPGVALLAQDKSAEALGVSEAIKPFMLKAGDALAAGGVHTPNHRWVISAALAQLHHLYGHKKYADRINDWLDEGIYQDADGHYAERSSIYSAVENTAYLTIARLMNKPALYEHVRKNLRTMYYYMEPSGQMVTNDSRRQDQYLYRDVLLFYYHYRYMAIKDNDPMFAAVAAFAEAMPNFEQDVLQRGLFYFLENPQLLQTLPTARTLPADYEKLFATTSLLRIRRGNTSATLFGGVDWPLIIASGRSNSPNFFAYRKGKAILKYARLSSQFFAMGYFYSEGLRKNGSQYVLHKKLEVPYYQPLPKNLRKKDGDYKLSPSIDDRFWNKMDFANRPVSNVKTLETTVTLTENNGEVTLDFAVAGLHNVPVTIELCFEANGNLTGVSPGTDGNYLLEAGMGRYEYQGDSIEFGPGSAAHKYLVNLEGERYSTHFGSLRTPGTHVFITGLTPFRHSLTFK